MSESAAPNTAAVVAAVATAAPPSADAPKPASGDTVPTAPIVAAPDNVVDPIDANAVWLVRGSIVALGAFGVVRLASRIKLFTHFRDANHVPDAFIRRGLRLQGKLAVVGEQGALHVRHVPIARLPFAQRVQRDAIAPTANCIDVRLAGVSITPPGHEHLRRKFAAYKYEPHVWFTPMHRSVGDNPTAASLECEVFVKPYRYVPLWTYSLNQSLVRGGLARVRSTDDPLHRNLLHTRGAYAKMIDRLVLAEQVADRRGVGMWRRQSFVESAQNYAVSAADAVKNSSAVVASKLTAETLKRAASSTRERIVKIADGTDPTVVRARATLDRAADMRRRHEDALSTAGSAVRATSYAFVQLLYYAFVVLYKALALLVRGVRYVSGRVRSKPQ